MTITSHPTDARYFGSRSQAVAAKKQSEKVVRVGAFAAGSFGVYPRMRDNGQRIGGPNARVVVWMTTAK